MVTAWQVEEVSQPVLEMLVLGDFGVVRFAEQGG
jgi:hypothetical protein